MRTIWIAHGRDPSSILDEITDLAAASSRFIARALDIQPDLRGAAGDYLGVLETASRATRAE